VFFRGRFRHFLSNFTSLWWPWATIVLFRVFWVSFWNNFWQNSDSKKWLFWPKNTFFDLNGQGTPFSSPTESMFWSEMSAVLASYKKKRVFYEKSCFFCKKKKSKIVIFDKSDQTEKRCRTQILAKPVPFWRFWPKTDQKPFQKPYAFLSIRGGIRADLNLPKKTFPM